MKWIWVILLTVALAGCSDAAQEDATQDTDAASSDDDADMDDATDEPPRDPSDEASTAQCDLAYAGSRTAGTDLQLGPATEECSVLLNPVDDEPQPFQVAVIEMQWDSADPTVDEVGFDFVLRFNGTEVGSAMESTEPGGEAGLLMVEVPLDGAEDGSLDVTGDLIFTGITLQWEASVVVSVFEVDSVPSGYSAF